MHLAIWAPLGLEPASAPLRSGADMLPDVTIEGVFSLLWSCVSVVHVACGRTYDAVFLFTCLGGARIASPSVCLPLPFLLI